MDTMQWAADEQAAQEISRFLDARIYEFNAAATHIDDGRLLALTVRDPSGAIVAGLSGWTWGGCLAVEYLWVHADWRGKSYGTRLLNAAEAEAVARGCTVAVLDTHSFQAPDFYRRLGYESYGVVDDCPAGHQHIHLRKRLKSTS
jgi:GNAT superfamily N-acetyltransferase